MTLFKRTSLLLLSTALALAACGRPEPAPAPPMAIASHMTPVASDAVRIARSADDLPPPLDRSEAETVRIELTTIELNGLLADGTSYQYWTFDGQVPGPLLRVRQGDTVELTLTNDPSSTLTHSIDLHAVNGPGGGAMGTQVAPGETKSITFKALNAGVYVYHCATPHIATHVAKGMYGLIVVEPESGLLVVDREFYVMQGEVYATGGGAQGHQEHDGEKQYQERPDFVVFNGQVGALDGEYAMQAHVGETVRLFVGNGGPNLISSFHVIGEVFDRVHPEGAREAAHDVQTTLIPAGGATWVEFTVDVPGRYLLVDHSLSRLDKGAVAVLEVTGPENPDVYHAEYHDAAGH